MKFPANESNIYAGDGTTTSTILATYALKEGLKYLEGLIQAGIAVDKYLISKSIPLTSEQDLYSICKIACNNDREMANMINSGLLSAGKDGAILIEEGNSMRDALFVKNI